MSHRRLGDVRHNGRRYFNLQNLNKVSDGHYTVEYRGEVYKIEGGKALGGGSREWFLSGPYLEKGVNCTSIADALRLLDEGF